MKRSSRKSKLESMFSALSFFPSLISLSSCYNIDMALWYLESVSNFGQETPVRRRFNSFSTPGETFAHVSIATSAENVLQTSVANHANLYHVAANAPVLRQHRFRTILPLIPYFHLRKINMPGAIIVQE